MTPARPDWLTVARQQDRLMLERDHVEYRLHQRVEHVMMHEVGVQVSLIDIRVRPVYHELETGSQRSVKGSVMLLRDRVGVIYIRFIILARTHDTNDVIWMRVPRCVWY